MLGLAVRRPPELRPGSVVLMAMVPVLALTTLLGLVAPDLAHPAYLETALAFGIALLGYRATEPAALPARDGATPAGV